MDGEEFFDRLYEQYYVSFPCYALFDPEGMPEAAPADDGTAALIVLTDDDLLDRYLHSVDDADWTVRVLNGPADISRLLDEIPGGITHITFDPDPRFHRRYPLEAVREGLTHTQG